MVGHFAPALFFRAVNQDAKRPGSRRLVTRCVRRCWTAERFLIGRSQVNQMRDWIERHRAGKTFLFALEKLRRAVHDRGAFLKCGAAMFAKNAGRATQLLFKLTFIERFKCFEDLARSRINR